MRAFVRATLESENIEVVEAANGGIFVEPSNSNAFADAVLHLNQNPHVGRTMGQNARKYVETHFERKQQAQQLVTLIESLSKK